VAKIEENLRTWLTGYASLAVIVGERVHVNNVPEESDPPYIWLGRAGIGREDAIDDTPGSQPFVQRFDCEIYAADIEQVMDAAELIHAKHAHRGTFGAGTVQGLFVTDHADDYIPRGAMDDEGLHGAFLQLEIVGNQ